MFFLPLPKLRNRPYWYALKPWWILIKQTDNPIGLRMCIGCGTHFTLQVRCFGSIPDRERTSVSDFSPTFATTIQTSPLGWSSLFACPKWCLCCEFLVPWLHLILGLLFFWLWFLKDLLWTVFFLLFGWNLLAALSTWVSEVLLCPVVHAEVWCWESWLRLYPVAGDTSWWTAGGWAGGDCALSEDSSALDHSFLLLLLWKQKPFLCMHACLLLHNPSQPFSGSPLTIFKLLSANILILILTSLHPLLGFLSSRSVYFPSPSLLPPCGSSALQECLHSSSPLINSLLSQSHLILFSHFPFLLHLLPFLTNLTSI